MSTENKIFKMSLDVSSLISNYKKAIQTMSDIGGPTRTIASFENQLKKLEKEFNQLSKTGKEGISKDPASVQAYTKAVEKAYRSLSNLGDEISKVGKDTKAFNINNVKNLTKEIEKAEKAAQQFQKDFAQALKDQGINKKTAEIIAQEARTEEELIKKLKEEKALREENLRIAKEAQSEKIKQTKESIKRSSTNLINLNSTDSASLTSTAQNNIQRVIDRQWQQYRTAMEKWKSGGQTGIAPDAPLFKTTKDYIQSINKELSESVRKGENFEDVWKRVVKEIQKMTGTTSKTSATGITRLNQSEIFGSYTDAANRTKRPFDEMAAASSTSSTATAVKGALESVNQINNIISQVSGGASTLNNSLTNVSNAERRVAEESSKMGAAIAADNQSVNTLTNSTQGLSTSVDSSASAFRRQGDAALQSSREIKKSESAISKFAHMIGSMFSIYTIFSSIRSEIRKTYEDIKTLDKSFASIAMVTDKSVQDMWATYDQYSQMASELGQKTNSVIEASALFYQQGLDTNEALELTTDTMKLATLAGENYKTATEEMTSAIRGFRMEMSEGAHVTDVYSTLAASAAASVNDIAQAMSRTASIANSAGASFENTSAFLTKIIETTQESAENIGDLSEFLNN